MGLPLLSSLTDLEVLGLEGEQDLTPHDVTWMIENWKSLRIVDAAKLAQNRTRFFVKSLTIHSIYYYYKHELSVAIKLGGLGDAATFRKQGLTLQDVGLDVQKLKMAKDAKDPSML
ncbi:hypothetical protein BGX21_002598, partial [Mortierella sp. AD011]